MMDESIKITVCDKCGAEVWAYCEQTVIERWNIKTRFKTAGGINE